MENSKKCKENSKTVVKHELRAVFEFLLHVFGFSIKFLQNSLKYVVILSDCTVVSILFNSLSHIPNLVQYVRGPPCYVNLKNKKLLMTEPMEQKH